MKITLPSLMRFGRSSRAGLKADIVVINNPIDGEVFQDRSARQRTKDFVVVYAGRVHPEKGLDILFEAAEQLALQGATRPVGLKMIGTWDIGRGGGGEDYVKRLERLAPHTKVEWVGEITDPKALATAIGDGDCFACPSAAAKGEMFGVAPLEAMALGLPTILSDLACFSDYAEAGVNSLRIALGENAVAEMRGLLRVSGTIRTRWRGCPRTPPPPQRGLPRSGLRRSISTAFRDCWLGSKAFVERDDSR